MKSKMPHVVNCNLAVTMLLLDHVIIHDANMELPLASIRGEANMPA